MFKTAANLFLIGVNISKLRELRLKTSLLHPNSMSGYCKMSIVLPFQIFHCKANRLQSYSNMFVFNYDPVLELAVRLALKSIHTFRIKHFDLFSMIFTSNYLTNHQSNPT